VSSGPLIAGLAPPWEAAPAPVPSAPLPSASVPGAPAPVRAEGSSGIDKWLIDRLFGRR
jgi:hypothetical protein